MIEVLISVFVLALGVTGAAGMQLAAHRTSRQSAFQTTALSLAAEMAEKMRAYDGLMKRPDNPFLNVDYQSAGGAEPPAPSTSCYSAGANCSTEELTSFDIYEWERRVKASLPDGRALICRDSKPWDSTAGAFTWTCDGFASDRTPLVIKLGWQGKNSDGSLIRDDRKQFPPGVVLPVSAYTK